MLNSLIAMRLRNNRLKTVLFKITIIVNSLMKCTVNIVCQ